MELSLICGSLIKKLNANNNSVKDFREKANEVACFIQTLESKKNILQEFIKSIYVVEVIHAILNLSVIATEKQSFQQQRFESIPRFFHFLAANNIPLAKEEKDIQKVINIIIDIIALHIPNAEKESWSYWLELFTEMMKIPSFFNMFRAEDENEDNGGDVSYAHLDTLFSLVDNLMKFKKIAEKSNEKQRSMALVFFSTFLEESPYPPLPDTIDSFFNLSDELADLDLPDKYFTYLLSILNALIAISPISFLIRSTSPFNSPFNEKILANIFEKWQNYQKAPFLRKSASAYLLLFLTLMDAMEYKIDQKFINDWAKRILEVWASVHRRAKIFESTRDIPYLRADVEFLSRSNDPSISRCLIQYILPNNKLNLNSSIVWLFTAIGTYAPTVISSEHWAQVLENISKYEIAEAALLNQDTLLDFYCLLSMMVDVIETNSRWNDVFKFLNKRQPSKEQTNPYYELIAKILSKQRVDTKVAHEYQSSLWNGRSDSNTFTFERLRCIHTFIYYYGFANDEARNECFTSLVAILDTDEKLPNDYMKQLSLTICSIVMSHACSIPNPSSASFLANSFNSNAASSNSLSSSSSLPISPSISPSTSTSFSFSFTSSSIADSKSSSGPIGLMKNREDTIDDVCNRLMKTLAITAAKKKVDTPLQNEEFFLVTPESSQVMADEPSQSAFFENPSTLGSMEKDDNEEDEFANRKKEKTMFALCNFIKSEAQKKMVHVLQEKLIPCDSNACFFRLFLTSTIPDFFAPTPFFTKLEEDFTTNCNAMNFPTYMKILLKVAEEIHGEEFQPFFEDIESVFFELAQQYISRCEEQIRLYVKDSTSMSWCLLNNASYEDYFEDLPIFAEFAVECSHLASGTADRFYECFQDFLSTSNWIPTLHLKICSYLLKLTLSEQQISEIVVSLECITTRVLQTLLVPIRERELFINSLFDALDIDNSEAMEDLFKTISKYSITPSMKQSLLTLMQSHYMKANQIFDCFWQKSSCSPFFILDEYPNLRLQSIDTVVSILKLKEIITCEDGVSTRWKFDKEKFFTDFIDPYIKDILEEPNSWDDLKQAVFTTLKTLINIIAEIPELSIKCLNIIFRSFTYHSLSTFLRQCLNVLFSGLSSRVHFSVFLRQFIPMMISQFGKLDSFAAFPFKLFFFDEPYEITDEQAKKKFCTLAAPYAIAYSTATSNQKMIDFYSNAIGISTKDLLQEQSPYVCAYLLEVLSESVSDEEKRGFKEMYNKLKPLMPSGEFESPIPLLSFVSMASENSVLDAYEVILRKGYDPEFIDIRNFIFSLYTTIFKAHHELIQSFYLQQFSLYASILFKFHIADFEDKPTLYSDLLALTVNLIEFVPSSESSRLLIVISQNIPRSFNMKMVGFVKNIEDICLHLKDHQSLSEFFDRFPKLIDKILIMDFMMETQIERRTPLMEFKRIAKTRRLNQESINFLLKKFINEIDTIAPIDDLPNDMKRTVLGEVYKYAVNNPHTLALHLYSEMYLRFVHIHPSPLIIGSNANASVSLFKTILELARDKNPSLSRSALTSLHILVSKSMLPSAVGNDKFLMEQLMQYKDFARPRKNVKQPEVNAPWICKFICGFIAGMKEDQLCSSFGSIAAISPEFCRQLFPHLFSECLKDDLFTQIIMAFRHFARDPKKYIDECRLFVTAFNYLRAIWFLQDHNEQQWHLKWGGVQLDFNLIMKTCLEIGDPFSAYQYAEFAHEAQNIREDELRQIFTQLGVNDLKYGLNTDFSNPLAVAELHAQEGRMGRALVLYDSAGDNSLMCESLRSLHLYSFLDKMKSENIDSLWRLRKWTVSSAMAREMKNNSHSACLFTVMQAFATNNEAAVVQKLSDFQQNFHFDENSSVFTQLSYLLNAAALQWFQAVLFPNNSTKLYSLFPQDTISLYRRSLERLNQLTNQYYGITESANALHGVFFCIADSLKTPISPAIPPQFFSNVITHARENGEIESAQYFVSLLRENQKNVPQFANFEQIQILYSDNPHHAVALLEKNYESLILTPEQMRSEKRRNVFNLRVDIAKASWSAHTNYLQSDQIYAQLENVIEKAAKINSLELNAEAEFILARFYHRQHREICDYFTSAEYNTIVEIIENGKALIEQKGSRRASVTLRTTKQDVDNYQAIIDQHRELFSRTIVKAIEHYMNTLSHTNKYDLEASFSIVGLWFDYSYTKYKQFVQEVPDLIPTMEETFPNIDAIKFLPLFYQLAARVDDMGEISATQSSDYNSRFQEFLRDMVTSICQKAPSECFPVLFALIKNDLVKQTSDGILNVNHKKIEAISDLIMSITNLTTNINNNNSDTPNKSCSLSEHWTQLQKMLTSYLLLANAPQMNNQETSLSKLANGKFSECVSSKMPLLTIITNAKEVGIARFQDRITVLNGVNHPMLLKIEGTDGRTYKQIVKGNKDDLRQDAVMQQLFVLSSKLLSRRNPNLSVRHYKVIPLSPTAGVIEFVECSMSIQDFLYKKIEKDAAEGAHTRYHCLPTNDQSKHKQNSQNLQQNFQHGQILTYEKVLQGFFNQSNQYHKQTRTEQRRLELIEYFRKIRSTLKPVFRFFFVERFPNPGDWFVSRLRYCRHTATNSIVGHILGIGDRHLNNILIDEKTGEVIHIDLGIAFDQGKALPIMEKVPFRLTNEIIDGMGWMGKEGIFRRACEESMAVLRSNSEYLLTVLKVFMSDPLYNWSLNPKKQRERATGFNEMRASGDSKNQFAESVIVTCRRKLEGRDTGENLSVEGQVSKLIIDATSDENLAVMFSGWKPFL